MDGPAAEALGQAAEDRVGVAPAADEERVERGAVGGLDPGRAVREVLRAEGDVVPRLPGDDVDLRQGRVWAPRKSEDEGNCSRSPHP